MEDDKISVKALYQHLNQFLSVFSQLGHLQLMPITQNDNNNNNNIPTQNLEFQYFDDYSTAYVKINSFLDPSSREEDKILLFNFYERISDYENLIIDVSNNSGGWTDYWYDLIVLPNIDFVVNTDIAPKLFFQDSELSKAHAERMGYIYRPIEESDFEVFINYNEEDFDLLSYAVVSLEFWYDISEDMLPEQKRFDGDIYVLQGPGSFSATTMFVQFCKDTGFATTVGYPTRGGNGASPMSVALSNTGFIVLLDVMYPVNELGQNVEEYGVLPDIHLNQNNTELKAALDAISQKTR